MPFVAAARAGDGQTAQVTTLPIVIPSTAAAGQVAVLFVDADANPTLTNPTGWTLRHGPVDAGTNQRSWVYTKTLAAGEPGATLNLAFGVPAKCGAVMLVFSGHTETGLLSGTPVTQTGSTSTHTLPTLAGVPAGAMLVAGVVRRRAGAAPPSIDFTGTPYTAPANGFFANGYPSGTNAFAGAGYAVTAGGGAVGGEAPTATQTSVGSDFLLALPATGPAALNRLRIGDEVPTAIRIGDSTVSKVYVGDIQVWP